MPNQGLAGSSFNFGTTDSGTMTTGGVSHSIFRNPFTYGNMDTIGGQMCASPITVIYTINAAPPLSGFMRDMSVFSGHSFDISPDIELSGANSMVIANQNSPSRQIRTGADLSFDSDKIRGSVWLDVPGGGVLFDQDIEYANAQPGVLILTYNPGVGVHAWLNNVPVTATLYNTLNPDCSVADISNPSFSGSPGISGLYRPLKPAASGHYWYGIGAVGVFRGRVPTPADRTYWQNQFSSAQRQPTPIMWGCVGPTTESFTVPTRSSPWAITSLLMTVRGATGYLGNRATPTSFVLNVSGGDVITVEAGGGGGDASSGAGGWPDGGNGGICTHANADSDPYGGGGGGSTRIYKNGNLEAIIGGGGGGSLSQSATSIGARSAFAGLTNGIDAQSGDGGLTNGKGATSSAGGAAGSSGSSTSPATAGTFGNGGNGASQNTNGRTGGGGGGGGYYGGGGGGSEGTGVSHRVSAGGSGSNWFGTSVGSSFRTSATAIAGTASLGACVMVQEYGVS